MVLEEVCITPVVTRSRCGSEQEISSETRRAAWKSLLLDGLSAKDLPLEAQDMYRSLANVPSSYDDVIQRDVGRTLPQDELFRDRGGRGQSALFRLLHALAVNNADIGYVQSLNFIVATLINVFPDDESLVFSCAQSLLFRHSIADFYRPSFPKLGVAIWQFDRLVEGFLPKAHAVLDAHGVTAEFYAMEWFLTLFASDLAQNVVVQVWDRFLLVGWQVIAQVALALVAEVEDELWNLQDSCEAMQLLKRFTHKRRFEAQYLLNAASKFDVSHRMLSDLEAAYSRGEGPEETRLVVDEDAETGVARWSVQREAPPKMRRSASNHSIGSNAEPLPRAFDRKDSQSSGSLRSSRSSQDSGNVKSPGNSTCLPFLIHNLDTGETTLLEEDASPGAFVRKDSLSSGFLRSNVTSQEGRNTTKSPAPETCLPFLIHNLDTGEKTLLQEEWSEYTCEKKLNRVESPPLDVSPTLLRRLSSRGALPVSPAIKQKVVSTTDGPCGGSFWVKVQQEQALRALGQGQALRALGRT